MKVDCEESEGTESSIVRWQCNSTVPLRVQYSTAQYGTGVGPGDWRTRQYRTVPYRAGQYGTNGTVAYCRVLRRRGGRETIGCCMVVLLHVFAEGKAGESGPWRTALAKGTMKGLNAKGRPFRPSAPCRMEESGRE